MPDDLVGTVIPATTLVVPSGLPGVFGSTGPTGDSGPTGPGVTLSDTPPSPADEGDLWWDSVSGQLFLYYVDDTSEQWVLANVPEPGPPGAEGPQGESGEASFSPTTSGFTVPAIGGTVTVSAEQTDWVTPGAYVNVGPMIGQVVSVSGVNVTVERVAEPQGQIGPAGPPGSPGPTGPPGPNWPMGVTDGSDAAPGEVGEYMEMTGVPTQLVSSGVNTVLAQLTITPGDWQVSGMLVQEGAITHLYGIISPTDTPATGNDPNPYSNRWGAMGFNPASSGANLWGFLPLVIGPTRVNIAATTVYYLVGRGAPAGTVVTGWIGAWRMR